MLANRAPKETETIERRTFLANLGQEIPPLAIEAYQDIDRISPHLLVPAHMADALQTQAQSTTQSKEMGSDSVG